MRVGAREGKRVWSNTAGAWAWETIGNVYEERVETAGQVPRGYERYRDFVETWLLQVLDQIADDHTTRQAMMVWPYQPKMFDPPCFFAAQVLYREPDVHLVVYMRSSDKVKFLSDVVFFRWMADRARTGLDLVGLDTRYTFLTVFKGSDHDYEVKAL